MEMSGEFLIFVAVCIVLIYLSHDAGNDDGLSF